MVLGMNEEIKDIIDYINDRVIPNEKWEKIKDYITDLQEENDRLKDELKRLHNLLNSQAYKDLDNYKSRIDKAIKLLKEAGCYDEETKTFCDDIYYELPNILNALEGSDKE